MNKTKIVAALLIIIILAVALIFIRPFLVKQTALEREAAIIYAEDGRRVTPFVLESLKDPDPDVRRRAVLAVGRIGDTNHADRVFVMMTDSTVEVAQAAAFAVGLFDEPSFANRLLNLAPDLSPEILAPAVQSISRLADTTMTDIHLALTDLLDHLDHRVRQQAAYGLWRTRARSAIPKLMEIVRIDPVKTVRAAALFVLVRLDAREAIPIYLKNLPETDPYFRSLSVTGLGLTRNPDTVSHLATGLNDRDEDVVAATIKALHRVGTPQAVEYLIKRFEDETDHTLKLQLYDALTDLGTAAVADYANDDLHNENSSVFIKAAALDYLVKIGGDIMIPMIDSLVVTENWIMKSRIAATLKKIGGDIVEPRLRDLWHDSSFAVRMNAFKSLCEVNPANIDYYITQALKDKDPIVQSGAVEVIGDRLLTGQLHKLSPLIAMREKLDAEVKYEMVLTMEKILKSEPDSLAENILFSCLMDKQYIVSKEAARVYKEVLDQDKSAFINLPAHLTSERKLRGFLKNYRTNPKAHIRTGKGEIILTLYADLAPLNVYNFIRLAGEGFYTGLTFHRVAPNHVIQGGDPRGTGHGGPGYFVRDEYSPEPFETGTVGLATFGEDTGGSQFFICLSPRYHLNGNYTLFGKVEQGMEIVHDITRGDTIEYIRISEVE